MWLVVSFPEPPTKPKHESILGASRPRQGGRLEALILRLRQRLLFFYILWKKQFDWTGDGHETNVLGSNVPGLAS